MEPIFPEYKDRSANEQEIKERAKAKGTTYYPVWVIYFVSFGRAAFEYACKTEHIANMIIELECCSHHAWKQEDVEVAKQTGNSYWIARKEYEICPDFYCNGNECPYDFRGNSAYLAYKSIKEIEDLLNKKRKQEKENDL